ncbi:MAG: AI-2E family transporter [Luteitalea sp.]
MDEQRPARADGADETQDGHALPAVQEAMEPSTASSAMAFSMRSLALTVLTTIAVIWVLYVTQSLLVPLIVGIILSLVLEPLVTGLTRVGLPRSAGAAIVLTALTAGLLGAAWQLSVPAAALADELPAVARHVRSMLARTTASRDGTVANIQEAADELATVTDAPPARDRSGAQPVRVVEPPTRLRDYLLTGTGIAGQVLLVGFLVFFLLASGDLYKRKLVKLTGPSLTKKKITVQIIDEIDQQIGVYLRTLTAVCTLVGLATWLAYRSLGMPNAAIWGLLAAIANVVPYVGPTLVSLAATAMALAHFGSIGTALTVGGAQVVITSIEGFLLTPMLMSRSARMNPVAMFVGLLFWGWLWGAWGMVLAVPLLMAIKAVADRVEDFHAVGELLGE